MSGEIARLNGMCPAAKGIAFGTLISTIVTLERELAATINELITQYKPNMVVPAVTLAGLSVDGVNPENCETDNSIILRHNGVEFIATAVAELDISALSGGDATIAQNKDGVLWIFINTAGGGDAEVDKDAQDYATEIEAWAAWAVAANTLPPGTDDICIGAIFVSEDNDGAFTWGTDSLTTESAVYKDFCGLPGVEVVVVSLALDAAAATFTYGAVTVRLGDGTRVAATGKANVTISGSNVADGAVGAWLFYVLADDVEIATQLGAAYADLATAQAAVRDHSPNPYLPLAGVIYVQNASGAAFVPGTTNLDATGITTTFVSIGPGSDLLEFGRAQLGQPNQVIQSSLPAVLT